jgi:hypothetical protein
MRNISMKASKEIILSKKKMYQKACLSGRCHRDSPGNVCEPRPARHDR